MHADGGVNSGWGCEISNRAYGLNDPSLEGFPGDIFKVLVAPVKVGAKVVKTAVKTAVRVAPGAVTGFIAGGPAGAVIGGASRLLPTSGAPAGPGAYTATPVVNVGSGAFPRSPYSTNPYGVESSAYQTDPYQTQYVAQDRGLGDRAAAVWNLAKDELFAAGGRFVADTPAGRQAIREKVKGDIGQYMLPIAIGGGALLLVMAMRR